MKPAVCKFATVAIFLAASLPAWSQTCQTRDEIPQPTRNAIEGAAQQVFVQASQGDVNAMRAGVAPSFQNGYAGVVNDNKAFLAGGAPQLRTSFLLDTGPTPSQEGTFYCGVFGASGLGANGAEFNIPGLPVGRYALVIQDVVGVKGPYAITSIFQDVGGWKLAGFYVRPESSLGHDGLWYLTRARDFKAKGQNHNAWFYYNTSWELLAPVKFMDTTLLSKIVQESNGIQPKDVPLGDKAVQYSANGKTYSITDMSVYPNGNNFDLTVRYSVPSATDFNAAQADARGLANALVAQYPELKEVFNNIWAHAVDRSGNDVVGLVNLKKP